MKILLSGGALGQLPQEVKSMSKIIMTVFFVIILVLMVRRCFPPSSTGPVLSGKRGRGGAKLAARNAIHCPLFTVPSSRALAGFGPDARRGATRGIKGHVVSQLIPLAKDGKRGTLMGTMTMLVQQSGGVDT
jgi:hypothetical protein